MTPDITIVGTGIVSVDHLTLETERAVRAARQVLLADTGIATRAWMEARCDVVTDIYASAYQADRPRFDAYHHMAARVIEAALADPPVVFAIHGHPLVFAYPPFLVQDLAAVLGLSVRTLPGISATAAILCDLGIDPCTEGMQMYEATDLLVHKRPLQPDVPALIWQIGNVETRLHSPAESRPERFDRFRDHVLRFYPADHIAIAVYCSPHPLMKPVRFEVALGEIGTRAADLHIGFTLFIPPVGTRPVRDPELLARLDDPAHLAAITR